MEDEIIIHWFRRDLRLHDNHALYAALNSGLKVLPIFIFDRNILDKLIDPDDSRVGFIHQQLYNIHKTLIGKGSGLHVFNSTPEKVFAKLFKEYKVKAIYTNHDFEPYALDRDSVIQIEAKKQGVSFQTFKDQVLFERNEVTKDDGKPYTIYTPFSRKWKALLVKEGVPTYPSESLQQNFYPSKAGTLPSLLDIGFGEPRFSFPDTVVKDDLIKSYDEQRNFPAINGTSRLGLHLRFGTLSIRTLIRKAQQLNETWLNELCWREFYMMILWHFPHVVKGSFKPIYDTIRWRNNEDEFERWKDGKTGYPIVDAGMRELSQTGYMHNRVRMITASFLTKHLLIDWRWGEAWFAEKLLDFELASNNGGWQWAAGSGCDAAPYFRIFNPYEQTRKFDSSFQYIRKWVPEFEDFSYPSPIVDHKEARERCIKVYSAALKPQ